MLYIGLVHGLVQRINLDFLKIPMGKIKGKNT